MSETKKSLAAAQIRSLDLDITEGMNGHYDTHRFLSISDFCLVWVAAFVAKQFLSIFALAFGTSMPQPLLQIGKLGVLFLFSILLILFLQSQREYATFWKRSPEQETGFLIKATLCAALVTGVSIRLLGIGIAAKLQAILSVILCWILLMGWRKFLRSQPIAGLTEKRNVVVVGCGSNGKLLRKHIESHPELGYVFKGYIDRRLTGKRPNPARNQEEGFIIGPADNLVTIVREHFIDEVFVSVPSDRNLVRLVAKYARQAGVLVRVIPDIYDGLAFGQTIEFVGQFPTLTLHGREIRTFQLIMKRLIDVIVSATALVLLLPMLLLVSILVKLDSDGPAFYESIRVGKKGKTFVCFKFRTMAQNADELQESLAHLNERQGILFKISEDPRVTGTGRFLRKYSIDELPQLWNVLKGDMSLVGPRPPVPREYDQYALEHLCRLDVTPGVTGLWQVNARRNPSFESYIELDKKYVNNWSFWLDCQILWKTIGVVLTGTGQ